MSFILYRKSFVFQLLQLRFDKPVNFFKTLILKIIEELYITKMQAEVELTELYHDSSEIIFSLQKKENWAQLFKASLA